MARIRNNQGHRNKILNIFMRPYLEQENTQEREAYLQAREIIKPLQDKTWQLASKIVRRHYTDEEDYDSEHSEGDQDDKYITKHFDFRLDGNINGSENSRQNDFAYAYFRDELKGKINKGEKCNPDINIEQKWGNGSGEENASNPHWTQVTQANETMEQ